MEVNHQILAEVFIREPHIHEIGGNIQQTQKQLHISCRLQLLLLVSLTLVYLNIEL